MTEGRAAVGRQEDFTEYVVARGGRLRETAYLMCGDWHRAQDLTQSALTKVYVAWPRIQRQGAVDAYTKQVLLREFLSHRRRHSSAERPSDCLPDVAGRADPTDLRMSLMEALDRLSPRKRAVVVLRYWDDLSVDAVAHLLRMTPSNVKTTSARALADLRAVLGESFLCEAV